MEIPLDVWWSRLLPLETGFMVYRLFYYIALHGLDVIHVNNMASDKIYY